MYRQAEELSADASSLIDIAKCGAFASVARCVGRILVVPSVWLEAVEAGEQIGAPEVGLMRAAHEAGFLRRLTLSRKDVARAGRLAEIHRLGRGESEVLVMAGEGGRCIVDEGRASRVAMALGLAPIPTLLLPVLGYRSGGISREESISLLRRLAVVAGARAEVVFAIEEELTGGRQ